MCLTRLFLTAFITIIAVGCTQGSDQPGSTDSEASLQKPALAWAIVKNGSRACTPVM